MTHYKKMAAEVRDLARACGRDPKEITIVAVSKEHPIETIKQARIEGCIDFGENRLREAVPKTYDAPDLQWHFVGALQRNKVGKSMDKFCLIHSVDNVPLAEKMNTCHQGRAPQRVLLQVNTSGEGSKQGWTPEGLRKAFPHLATMSGLNIEGLMTMAPLTDDSDAIRACFRSLRELRDELGLTHLSMGMSSDYAIAIEEGATLLRIGSKIFGT